MKAALLTTLATFSPFKKSLVAVSHALLACSLSSCVVGLDWQAGNGVAVTETRHLPAFTRVRTDASVHVVLQAGNGYRAYVTGDANLVAYYETETYGGTLTISQAYAIDPLVEPSITVVVPDLRAVEHNGMGVLEILEDGNFPDLSLTLNGSGEIRFSGTASTLRAPNNGFGRIYAEGYAAYLKAEMNGPGEISAEYLLAGDASVDLSGSGDVYLDLDYGSDLKVNLAGSGRVEWWGAPSTLKYNLTGTGRIIEHRGLPKRTAGTEASSQGKAGAPAAKTAAGPYETVKRGAGLGKARPAA